jgi:hypothetical protein
MRRLVCSLQDRKIRVRIIPETVRISRESGRRASLSSENHVGAGAAFDLCSQLTDL